jgi:hypothetical protein
MNHSTRSPEERPPGLDSVSDDSSQLSWLLLPFKELSGGRTDQLAISTANSVTLSRCRRADHLTDNFARLLNRSRGYVERQFAYSSGGSRVARALTRTAKEPRRGADKGQRLARPSVQLPFPTSALELEHNALRHSHRPPRSCRHRACAAGRRSRSRA